MISHLLVDRSRRNDEIQTRVVDGDTDAACRSYLIASPSQLEASDHVSLNLSASFPSSFDSVYLSSISVILSPSTAAGVLSPNSGREPIQDPAQLSDPASSTGSHP